MTTAIHTPSWRAALAIAGACVLVPACKGAAPAAPQMPPMPVTVAAPVERDVREWFETTGRVEAVEKVEVRPRVPGHLVAVNVEDGAQVKAGDVLFEIDPRPYQAAVHSAEADVARLEALRRKSQADVDRNRKLRPEGAASERDLETAVWNVETAEAEIKAARARLEEAQLELGFTRVTAPISGRVSKRNITVGNLVQVGAGDASILTTLVSIDPIYVGFHVDEPVLLRYQEYFRRTRPEVPPAEVKRLGVPVEIGLANETGYSHTGVVDFIDNRVDAATGTIPARAVFENPDQMLTPGLFVRVRVPFGDAQPSLLVPEVAIGSDQATKFVMVVNAQNLVEMRPVELGASTDDRLRVVKKGIAAGEHVIVNGLMRARPGAPVVPHAEGEAPAMPGGAAPGAAAHKG
ncbi:MAG: efflux RND transporter periplasmic adaptor subunit [bacterium]